MDIAGVRNGLDILLRRGYVGAFVILTDERSGGFVQFRKYITASREIGIEMDFPRAEWSEPIYSDVQVVLRRHSVEYTRDVLPSDRVPETIYVDFARETLLASTVARDIAIYAFHRSDGRLSLRAHDICPLDRLIDDVDALRPRQRGFGMDKANTTVKQSDAM